MVGKVSKVLKKLTKHWNYHKSIFFKYFTANAVFHKCIYLINIAFF
jgi:hypothetical protein